MSNATRRPPEAGVDSRRQPFTYKEDHYLKLAAIAAEFESFVRSEFVDTMRARGHDIEIFGDEIIVKKV